MDDFVQQRAIAEDRARRRVMLDSLQATEELLAGNVGAKLAADHYQLMGSVSPVAIVTAWRWQAEARAGK